MLQYDILILHMNNLECPYHANNEPTVELNWRVLGPVDFENFTTIVTIKKNSELVEINIPYRELFPNLPDEEILKLHFLVLFRMVNPSDFLNFLTEVSKYSNKGLGFTTIIDILGYQMNQEDKNKLKNFLIVSSNLKIGLLADKILKSKSDEIFSWAFIQKTEDLDSILQYANDVFRMYFKLRNSILSFAIQILPEYLTQNITRQVETCMDYIKRITYSESGELNELLNFCHDNNLEISKGTLMEEIRSGLSFLTAMCTEFINHIHSHNNENLDPVEMFCDMIKKNLVLTTTSEISNQTLTIVKHFNLKYSVQRYSKVDNNAFVIKLNNEPALFILRPGICPFFVNN
ncbi:MAG: hypothetical protein KatS3mg085_509 [Candidatus Dojkabacteria bacterium]|nr:MAG: hypothetical protein KatS3mg085_509 [Candidatus Dojkabacteria bacterium]